MLQNICISGESSAVRVRLSLIISFDILKQRSIPAVDAWKEDFFGKLRKTVGVDPPIFQRISLLVGNRIVQITKLKFSVAASFTAHNNIAYVSAVILLNQSITQCHY